MLVQTGCIGLSSGTWRTRMRGARSDAISLVACASAAFAVPYARYPRDVWAPAIEPMFRIDPPPRLRMCGTARRDSSTGEVGAASPSGENYPAEVTNIVVGRACQRLHFLHAAINAPDAEDGKQIGSYVVTHTNGHKNQIPILIGRDVADWFTQPNEENKHFTIAWTGWNAESRRQGRMIRLFKTTWENPQPTNAVQSIDFNLNGQPKGGQPFLVSITVE